jgi:hypothetical protein
MSFIPLSEISTLQPNDTKLGVEESGGGGIICFGVVKSEIL